MPENPFPYSAADLRRFAHLQRLAYDIAERVHGRLRAGMTESEVCSIIASAQATRGITQNFHRPFAWFGRRTLLHDSWAKPTHARRAHGTRTNGDETATQTNHNHNHNHNHAVDGHAHTHTNHDTDTDPGARTGFDPTTQRLSEGMPLIIDLAPVAGGITTDVAHSCVFGSNDVFDELDTALARIRSALLEAVRARQTLRAIYRDLYTHLRDRGWTSCHRHYPGRALGHMVFPLGRDPDHASPIPGLGTAAAEGLLAAGATARLEGTCYPVWSDSPLCDYPATPGLWAVEPHIGLNGVGVKFEEIMVVTERTAYWLDDDLPHTKRWAAARYSTSPSWRP